jgi:hypothetical protein
VLNGDALDHTVDGAVHPYRDVADLAQVQKAELLVLRFEPKARLVVGDGAKTLRGLESQLADPASTLLQLSERSEISEQ